MKINTLLCAAFVLFLSTALRLNAQSLKINDNEYFEKPGLNVMVLL